MLNKCLLPKPSLVFLLSKILPHLVRAVPLQPRFLPLLLGAWVLESSHSGMKDEKLKNTDMQEWVRASVILLEIIRKLFLAWTC